MGPYQRRPDSPPWLQGERVAGPRLVRLQGEDAMLFKTHPLKDPALRQQITQGFGEHPEWYSRFTYDGVPLKGHNGIDFGVPTGTEIEAADDGTVIENSYDPNGFGYYVKLGHSWGESLYAHLSKPGDSAVSTSQPMRAGQVVGLSDDSGFSTGPHLHFGIRVNSYRQTTAGAAS